jgi:hypothetical protein
MNMSVIEDIDSLVDIEDIKDNPRVELPLTGDPRMKKLSYSSSLLLHTCPRKYQLIKLGTNTKKVDPQSQLTFDFGHTVGEAVVDLLCGKSRDEVIFNIFLNWPNHLFAEDTVRKKSLAHAIFAVDSFLAAREQGLLEDYEVVYFSDGRPAAEVSFKLNFPDGYTERGYVDMVLRNKYTGQFTIVDNKTSSARYLKSEQYQNSMQALGYSLVLDKFDPTKEYLNVNYTVFYLVWMTFLERWEVFEFPKTPVHRAQWLQAKLWDIATLERLRNDNGDYGLYPIFGESCMSFGKACPFMGECHMETESLITPLRQTDIETEELDRFGKPWDIELDIGELLS